MSDLEQWDAVDAEDISTQALDEATNAMLELWNTYEVKKKLASEALAEYEEAETVLMDLLKRAKKSKYFIDGVGTVSIRNQFVVRTPKTPEEKTALFNFIRDNKGPEALIGLVSINHQTLQAFVNSEKETNPEVIIPGLEAPTLRESLQFRASKK